jgi:hypothetical protein
MALSNTQIARRSDPFYGVPRSRAALLAQRARTQPARMGFIALACALAAFHIYSFIVEPSVRMLGAALISAGALVPSYIWCRRPSLGLPIFPLFALTFVWKYAYPLASDDTMVTIYDDAAGLRAGLIICMFLLIGTVVWCAANRWVPRARGPVRAMSPGKGDLLFTAFIFCAALFNLSVAGHWFFLAGGVVSIVRAAVLGLASVGIFVLAYRWGAGDLGGAKKAAFGTSFVLFLVSHSMSLFMIDLVLLSTFAIAAYVIGGGRLPWKTAAVLLVLFSVLHAGKSEMRDEYWLYEEVNRPVQLYEYPGFLREWIGHGMDVLTSPPREDTPWSLTQRMSLIPLLLKVQAETPEKRPFLNGETYAIIPGLLVPRVLNPKKLNTHEGAHLLSIHFGLQTREATETSTIAWGPLIEAYANFGILGVIGLAVVIGALYGAVAKFATGVPILSLRMLIAIVFSALALQVEWTAGVYVTALFQSLVVVCALSFVLMERRMHTGMFK